MLTSSTGLEPDRVQVIFTWVPGICGLQTGAQPLYNALPPDGEKSTYYPYWTGISRFRTLSIPFRMKIRPVFVTNVPHRAMDIRSLTGKSADVESTPKQGRREAQAC